MIHIYEYLYLFIHIYTYSCIKHFLSIYIYKNKKLDFLRKVKKALCKTRTYSSKKLLYPNCKT